MLNTLGGACISRQELLAGVLTVLWRDLSLKIDREVKFRFPGFHRLELAYGENGREAGLERHDCQPNGLDILPSCRTHGCYEREMICPGGAYDIAEKVSTGQYVHEQGAIHPGDHPRSSA